ncbi:hypothetical protein [Cytobacillus purgationiresistens]|uniref:DNA-binding ferritin-like protein (Dps family) n=1 Tax=Cytobacillus purgationiresistens TaxID=863449 RepID=A0ABU0AD37_9BACI|nr:hypothetical protein [Cytobacillus purgationiresistens]MDQ0269154.1 DNA-binding ferritin-like protein (Dps family) [Cytobacillus purgationiresistens]
MLKKAIVITVAFCFLMGLTAFFAEAYSKSSLFEWANAEMQKNKDVVGQGLNQEVALLNDDLTEKTAQSIDEKNAELSAFLLTSSSETKDTIKNYQGSYLYRLEEKKKELLNQDLSSYEERKKRQINEEMDADIEEYLAELLGQ